MTSPIDSLIQEVDEDLRKDKALVLAKRYGPYAVALALGIVIAVAGVLGWRHYKANRELERSATYAAALDAIGQGDARQAQEFLDAVTKAAPASGYGVLSRLQEAALKAKAGDNAAAAAVYRALADDSRVDPLFRDLGLVLYGLATLDTADPAKLTAEIKPLADGSGPWRFTAIEIEGYLALRTGDKAKAGELFSSIANDPHAPQEAQARAAAMASSLSAAETAAPGKPAPAAPVPGAPASGAPAK